jgi:histidinol-phosphate/aromatic aminotransferase/cobyric acid decarboxylase-like protein
MQKFATEANINAIVTQAAAAALDDVDATDDFIPRNTNDRQEFFNQAMARAVKPIDSHANFVMMNPFHPAEEVIEHFRKNNILIGHRSPPLDTHIRISFGPPRGNARILAGMGCLAVPPNTPCSTDQKWS